jgi:catechol 2,3-dioxygenase-like lactoylglutathione lyase family enzyme
MLAQSKLQSIVLTSQIQKAERFYREVLELSLRRVSDGILIFDVGGGDLQVAPVPATEPTEHTVLGFSVSNVAAVVDHLCARGVVFERFDGFAHDEIGILTTPDKSKVAWFRDPDGNLLSVVQYCHRHC